MKLIEVTNLSDERIGCYYEIQDIKYCGTGRYISTIPYPDVSNSSGRSWLLFRELEKTFIIKPEEYPHVLKFFKAMNLKVEFKEIKTRYVDPLVKHTKTTRLITMRKE